MKHGWSTWRGVACVLLWAGAAVGSGWAPAHAQAPSRASKASSVAVAVSVAGPVALAGSMLVAGADLLVVSVQTATQGTVWVLERASDGARLSLTVAGESAVAVGTGVSVVVTATGVLLSAAGQVLCFIPNEIGATLLHHEAVTR